MNLIQMTMKYGMTMTIMANVFIGKTQMVMKDGVNMTRMDI